MKKIYQSREMGWFIIALSLIGIAANIYSFAVATTVLELILRLGLASTNYIGLFLGIDLAARTKLVSFHSQHAEIIMTMNSIRIHQCDV